MKIILSLLAILCVANLAAAQSIVFISEDGKAAWYAPPKATTAGWVGRVVHLSGDTPTTPDPPDDPDDPPDPPTEDRWGLVAVSETAAKAVTGDPNRDETAVKVGPAFVVIGKQVQSGVISPEEIKAALELTFRIVVGDAQKAWRPWKDAMMEKLNSQTFANATEAGQGVIDVGLGASNSSTAAIEEGFLDEFLEKWLPFILLMLKFFGTSAVDTLLGAPPGVSS